MSHLTFFVYHVECVEMSAAHNQYVIRFFINKQSVFTNFRDSGRVEQI